jgi:hypothetical protein
MVIYESLWTNTDNLDQPILNKPSIVLSGYFSFVRKVGLNFDCIRQEMYI